MLYFLMQMEMETRICMYAAEAMNFLPTPQHLSTGCISMMAEEILVNHRRYFLPYIFESSSCVRAADYDGDGDMDLFVGVRLKPLSYGYPCKGYILQNNGKGIFTDVTEKVAPELINGRHGNRCSMV